MPRKRGDEWFWQVGADLGRLTAELSRLRPSIASHSGWQPRVDILEDESSFVLKVELAGVRAEDILLRYLPQTHSILIRGVRHDGAEEEERTGWYQLEILYGLFEREIRLPDLAIDPNAIKVALRNGMLTVWIGKREGEYA